MKFRLLTILFCIGALSQVRAQGNSIYSIAPMAVCWNTPADVDSNLIAYWLFSSRETTPKVVSYLTASGTAVVVAGGTVQNGFCCCSGGSQDTLGIQILGDTLILTQNGTVYTYIGGGGDDDWRWVDPGAGETMYEAIYRMGKASIFTEDTTHAFRVDSTFQFRVDGERSIFDWSRGDSLLPEKTWLFRAPGGATGQAQNDANTITIARTNAGGTRTTVGKIKFAAPFGIGDSLRTGAQIDVIDEDGGGATSNTSINFYTRQLGEAFIRNTMTIEGNGRLELDRYNLFEDGVPERILGYDDTDKDVKVSDITGNPQPGHVLGIDAIGTGMQWLDPDTLGGDGIYGGSGSLIEQTIIDANGFGIEYNGKLTFNSTVAESYPLVIKASVQDGMEFQYDKGSNSTYGDEFGVTQWRPRYNGSISSEIASVAGQYTGNGITRRGQLLFRAYDNGAFRNTLTVGGDTVRIQPASRIIGVSPELVLVNSTVAPRLKLYEPSGSGTNSIYLTTGALASDIGLTFPNTVGTAGQFLQTDGNNPAVLSWGSPSGTTNLTFSGASSPVNLNSSTGTDVTLTAGTNVTFSQASNNLTINATGDGNGIYGGSGSVPNGTAASLLGTFSIATAGGSGLYLNETGTTHILGAIGGNRFFVDPTNNLYSFGTSAGGTGSGLLRIYGNNAGDHVLLAVRNTNFIPYTLTLPENGDGSAEGMVVAVTSTGGGETEFAWPTVYLSFTHTSFQEVTIAEDGIGAIVIPINLDGYTIVSAAYRTQSAVSGSGNIAVELNKTTEGGSLTTGFLDDAIANGDRFVNATSNPMTVATGDLITCLATIGTATAEGLTVTLTLTK